MNEKAIKNKGGRPTNAERLAKRASAAQVLVSVNQQRMWTGFLESPDDRVALDAWKYLNDRVYGKPSQSMKLDAEVKAEPIRRVVVNL